MNQNTEKTIEAYNKNGNRYADKYREYPTYKAKILEFCSQYIPDGSRVLDLGCGPGNNASIIIDQKKDITLLGYDLSETMIELAQSNVPKGQFEILNINDLKTDIPFDVALASFCIVHLTHEETEHLLSKLSEIIPPCGFLFLSCMEGKKQGFETTCFSDSEIWFNYYDRKWLTDLLKKNGFVIEELSIEKYPEPDGSMTTDLFFFVKKVSEKS